MAGTIQVDQLVAEYRRRGRPTVRALDGVTFEVAAGHTCVLLGPNGAGKTSAMSCCLGFLDPAGGEVSICGLKPAEARRNGTVGVVQQTANYYAHLSLAELVRMFASLHDVVVDPAAALREVRLDDHAERRFSELSGGQQRRFSISLATIHRPQVVLLDEPTSGLDPHARQELWSLVHALKADGVTILLSTHAMDEAALLADHVVVLNEGRTVATGTPGALIGALGLPSTIRVRPTRELADGEADQLVALGFAAVGGDALGLAVADPTRWLHTNAGTLEALDVTIGVQEPTLEDVFFAHTGRGLTDA